MNTYLDISLNRHLLHCFLPISLNITVITHIFYLGKFAKRHLEDIITLLSSKNYSLPSKPIKNIDYLISRVLCYEIKGEICFQ